jgi:hypothetical protein
MSMTDPVSRLGEIKAAAATHGPDAEQVGWLLDHIEQLQRELADRDASFEDGTERYMAERRAWEEGTQRAADEVARATDVLRTIERQVERTRAQRQAVYDLCAAWMERTSAERVAADADPDPLARSYHRGLVDGSATAIERVRTALGADDDR